ncbi:MAG: NTP transferase domain-containing protein [Holophagaceae bacterium]|nr:NTP transferase domain-containing protein [Holophagaceae bacterium]
MPEPLEGFLLAAGLGLRMGTLSQCLPKPAWTLRGRPLLQWGAELLRREGVARLACNAHLWPERLRAVADGIEVCAEPQLLGSAGSLLHARGRVEAECSAGTPMCGPRPCPSAACGPPTARPAPPSAGCSSRIPGAPGIPCGWMSRTACCPRMWWGPRAPSTSPAPPPGPPRPWPCCPRGPAR